MPVAKKKPNTPLRERKQSHLDLCEKEQVEYAQRTTLFEEVELIHDSLPELALDEIDTSVELFGKRLRAPLVITGMTGGTADAFAVNRDLATVAESEGIAFGLGSQRVMQREPDTAWTFAVRDVAPTTVVLANIGLIQAVQQPTAAIEDLVAEVGADALCLHLNPAQELIQPEGDRDFRSGLDTMKRLSRELSVPVIAKETGCGISRAAAERLRDAGVRHLDISGAGGTSWVRVESFRGDQRSARLAELLEGWGIPTAAALVMVRDLGLTVIASGGIRNGLEVAKALALGARFCGVALPAFRAYRSGGRDGAAQWIHNLIEGLQAVMLLTAARRPLDLARHPVVLGARLRAWLDAAVPARRPRR